MQRKFSTFLYTTHKLCKPNIRFSKKKTFELANAETQSAIFEFSLTTGWSWTQIGEMKEARHSHAISFVEFDKNYAPWCN